MHRRRRSLRGMHISKRALRRHFDPRAYEQETYLLCKLQWEGSDKFWIHWVKNDKDNDCHAEKYFLQEIFEPRNYGFCNITLYLSWSPCPECCEIIRDFLERNPNVHIDIHVARIYYADRAEYRRGLRELNKLEEVNIKVMEEKDYYCCWETFIQRGVHYVFSAVEFRAAIRRHRLVLRDILTGLYL